MENQRSMQEVLKLQREHFLNEGPPSYELRIDRLDRVQDMVIQNKERITEALNTDFGSRSPNQSCLLYTSPSPRDVEESRMPSSA